MLEKSKFLESFVSVTIEFTIRFWPAVMIIAVLFGS
jgi:hypothetical protein